MGDFQKALKARLPLSVADYMAACNEHYYATRDPFGQAGDFTTAPEISQIFGECIGAFIAHIWAETKRTPFDLIEGGPGRGTLMADVMRAGSLLPDFHDKAEITLIETSPSLRERQKQTLPDVKYWVNEISEISLTGQNKYFIFNELFDAFPIQQFIFLNGIWQERFVNENSFTAHPADVVLPANNPQEGDIYELAPARSTFMKDVCHLLKHDGGMAIIIDYGTGRWGVGDSLQAMKAHRYVPVLETPGEVDLTSHVDFGALADVARADGLYVHPLMPQGAFLTMLGGGVRAQKLGQEEVFLRLAAPDQMGDLFKVLIVAHPDWERAIKGVFA